MNYKIINIFKIIETKFYLYYKQNIIKSSKLVQYIYDQQLLFILNKLYNDLNLVISESLHLNFVNIY